MRKAIFDTNVFIDWLRQGIHGDLMLSRDFTRYMSAVVQMELRAGAETLRAKRALDELFSTYDRVGRIVVPSSDTFNRAGQILRRLRAKGREIRRASMVNDVLIAVSARSIGATVFTADTSDFEAIAEVYPFAFDAIS